MVLIKQRIINFLREEEGMGTLEVLLIVAVLVAIALLFRGKIIEWVNTLLDKADLQIEQF
ncbi:MAG: Flp1 family type IVb pilin [Vulcanibacillus sp.]